MGEIVASMALENAGDREVVKRGLRDESTVRQTTVAGVVDTGAVMLVLPEDVVDSLGLRTQRGGRRHLRGRKAGDPPGRRARDGADWQPLHDRRVRRRPAIERGADRPDRAGSAGLGGGLRQSHAGTAPRVAGLAGVKAEVIEPRTSCSP